MKKIIILILTILLMAFFINQNYSSNLKDSNLVFKSINPNSNFNYYELTAKEDSFITYTYTDNLLYYILKNNQDYELYTLNLNSNQKEYIAKIANMDYCELTTHNVSCHQAQNSYLYDLNLNLLYTSSNNETIIPYKDTYLKLKDNHLTISQNNKETNFQDLSSLANNTLISIKYTNKDTYLLYEDISKNYKLYSINNKKYQTINALDYYEISQGYIFKTDESKYLIYDFNNSSNEVTITEEFSFLDYTNPYLFYLTDNLIINDIKTNTFFELALPSNSLLDLKVLSNYLFLTTSKGLYILDLTSLDTTTFLDINSFRETQISNLVDDIQTKYAINISIKEEALKDYPDFTALINNDNDTIYQALKKIANVLELFNLEFFQSFYDSKYEGLNINLTGMLTPQDSQNQASNPLAYSLVLNKKYTIVLDSTYQDSQSIICHELMHNLEFNLNNKTSNFLNKWNDYNPPGFSYANSYRETNNYSYTIIEENPASVYFIDSYAKTYPEEDHARIFELLCTSNTNTFTTYPNIQAKANYLQEEILKYYPSLESSTLFNNVKNLLQ